MTAVAANSTEVGKHGRDSCQVTLGEPASEKSFMVGTAEERQTGGRLGGLEQSREEEIVQGP